MVWVDPRVGLGWVVMGLAMGLAGLGQSFGGMGWIEEIGPTNNSG